ncbi:MAG: hypothetical protein R2814_07670 [Flavobacteriaceae bacterium]
MLSLAKGLPPILAAIYDTVIRWMNSIIGLVAQQEGFLFRNISFDAVQLILSYGIIIAMVKVLIRASYRRVVVFLFCILCFQGYVLVLGHLSRSKESLVIGHIVRNSGLIHRTGQKLTVFTSNPMAITRMANDYAIAQNTKELEYQPIKNSYLIRGKRMVILDSAHTSLPANYDVHTLVLTQSPKINLERLLDSIAPKIVIADGSNYKSYIDRWKATCYQKKLPFHYTGENGAFICSWQ